MHPLLASSYDREQRDNRCYYSPEKLLDFDFEEDGKCVVFELGMTLLHALGLRDCHEDCYNGFEVMQDAINDRIEQIWEIYQGRHGEAWNPKHGHGGVWKGICRLLTKMTRTVRSKRAGLVECGQILKEIEDEYDAMMMMSKENVRMPK